MPDTLLAIFTPPVLIAMIGGAVISQIVGGLIGLGSIGLGKTKNAVLHLLTEQSEKQKAIRLNRVVAMREDKNLVQFFVMQGTVCCTFSVYFLLLAMALAFIPGVKNCGNVQVLGILPVVVVGFCLIGSIYNLFRALVYHQDIGRAGKVTL